MEKLRTPLWVSTIYLFLLGLTTLTPSIATSVYGTEVRDAGTLLALSGLFFSFCVVLWAIANNTDRYGGLASAFGAALLVSAVFLVWGWATGVHTVRVALVPLIINVVLAGWMWSAGPKS